MSDEVEKTKGILIYGMLRYALPSPDEHREMLENEYKISVRVYDHSPGMSYICPIEAEFSVYGLAGGVALYPWHPSWNERIFGFCEGIGIDPKKTTDCCWHLILFGRSELPDCIRFEVAELSATEPVMIHVKVPDDYSSFEMDQIYDMAHAVLEDLPNASFIVTREGITVTDRSEEKAIKYYGSMYYKALAEFDAAADRRELFLVRATADLYNEDKEALRGTLNFTLGYDAKLGAQAAVELVRSWIDKLMSPEAVRVIGVLDVMLHLAPPPISDQCREIMFGCFRSYQDYEIKKAALEALVVHAVRQEAPVLAALRDDLRPYRDDEIIGEDVRRFTGDG